ncbi:MAG: hypothetical protein ACK5Z0_02680, partial [Planctomycetota bacterium]
MFSHDLACREMSGEQRSESTPLTASLSEAHAQQIQGSRAAERVSIGRKSIPREAANTAVREAKLLVDIQQTGDAPNVVVRLANCLELALQS